MDKVEEQGCLSRTMDVLDQQAEADRRCVDQLKPALQLQRGSTESFSSTSVANIDAAPSLSSAGQPSTSISTANTHPHSSVGDKNYSHVTSRTAGDVDYHHDADGTEEEELQLDREEAALQAELQRVLQDSAKKKARIPNIRHNNQADIGDALSRGYHNTKNKTMGDDASIPGPARTQQNTLSTVSSSPTATASMSAPPPRRPLSRPSSLDIVSPTLSDAPSLPPSVSPVQRLSPANTDRSCPPLPVPSSRPTPSPRSRAFSPAVPSPSPSRANTVTSMNQSTPSHTGRLNTRHDTSDNSPSVPPRRGRKDDNTFSSPVHNDINNKDYIKSMRSGDNKQGQYNVTSGSNGKLMGHDTVFDSVKRVGSNNHDIKMKGFPSMSAIDEKEEKGGVQSANTSTPVKSMSEGSNAASYGGNIDDTSDINDKIEEVKPVDVDNGIMSFHLDDDGEEDSTQPVASGWLASGKSNSIKTKGPRNNQWSTGNTAANNNSNDSNYNNNSKGISTNSRMSGVRSAQSSSASSAIVVSLNDTLESIGIADFSDTDDQHEYYGSNKNNCSTNIASHANNRPSSTATSTFMTLASTSSSVESADIKQLKSSDTWGLRSAEAAIESFDANDDVDSILHNNSNVIQSIDEEDFKTVKDFGSSSRSNLEHNTANSTVKKNIDRGSVWSKKKQGGSVRSVSNKHNSMGSSSNFMSSTDNNYKNENESNGARVPRRTSINAFGSDDLSSGVQRNKFTASSVSSLSSRGDAKKESTVISMFGLEDLDDDDDIDYIGGSSARSGSSSGAQGVGSFNKAPSGNVRSPSVCNKGSGMKFIDEDDLVEESFDDFDY